MFKKIIFISISIFIFLFLLESILRIAEFGGNNDFIIKNKNAFGEEVYSTNNKFTRKYYFGYNFYGPAPGYQEFDIQKKANSFRVFVLGESTVEGFPYPINLSFSNILKKKLQDIFPYLKIEIINCGISASTSFIITEISNEIVKYQPDLIIIHTGHNEIYGLFGPASSISYKHNYFLMRTIMKLMNLKITNLLHRGIHLVKQYILRYEMKPTMEIFMQIVSNNNYQNFNSPIRKEAIRIFEKNLIEIYRVFEKNKIPVILSTLLYNVKNQPPLHSIDFNNLQEEQLFMSAYKLYLDNKFDESLKIVFDLIKKNPLNARLFFLAGKNYYALNNFDNAENYLIKAKDYDLLPFRITEQMLDFIRNFSAKYKITLVDINKHYKDEKKNLCIGTDLIVDHLHPNINGNVFIADSFIPETVKVIEKKFKSTPNFKNLKPTQYYLQQLGYDRLIDIMVMQRLFKMYNKEPLNKYAESFEMRDYYNYERAKYFQQLDNEQKLFFKNWTVKFSTYHHAFYFLGKIYLMNNKLNEAKRSFEISLMINKKFSDSVIELRKLHGK